MALGAVIELASTFIHGKSPRYGGGDGPLYGTVNGFIDTIVSGDLAVIERLNQLRTSDADKVQWQLFWDQMLPIQPLTQAQVDLIKRLDPSKTAIVPRRGTAIYASPNSTPPTPQQVAQGLVHVLEPTNVTTTQAQPPLSAPAAAAFGGMPLWMFLLLGGVAAWVVYKVVKKG